MEQTIGQRSAGEDEKMRVKKNRMLLCGGLIMLICLGLVTGCSKGIRKETEETIRQKSAQALQIYADIEKMANDHALVVDSSFTDMKETLTRMSADIQKSIAGTTEEDGQLAIQELDRILANLSEVKDNVTNMTKDLPVRTQETDVQTPVDAGANSDSQVTPAGVSGQASNENESAATQEPLPTDSMSRDLSDLE